MIEFTQVNSPWVRLSVFFLQRLVAFPSKSMDFSIGHCLGFILHTFQRLGFVDMDTHIAVRERSLYLADTDFYMSW